MRSFLSSGCAPRILLGARGAEANGNDLIRNALKALFPTRS
jgi:hypothetical protein